MTRVNWNISSRSRHPVGMAVLSPWIAVLLIVALFPRIGAATDPKAVGAATQASKAVVLDVCERKCAVQKQTEELTLDVGCGSDCRVEQCSHGCKAWQRALDSSCPDVCNGTQSLLAPKELYCVMGCNDAVSQYIQKVKERIGTPKAPALVADTLGPTSLSLEWEKVPNLPGAVYLVQWRYESPSSHSLHNNQGSGRGEGEWQYCRNMSWGPETMRKIENLQPYTKYRFRIAVLLGPPSKELSSGTKRLSSTGMLAEPEVMAVSEPSVVVGTLGEGPPSSPPVSVRATAADPTRVSVSWEPGPFPNGPVLSYVLAISETMANATNTSLSMHQNGDGWLTREGNFHTTNELPPGFSAVKDIPDSENTNSYMFQNLLPNRNYTVSVRMRNGVGEGPVALTTVSTPPELTEKDNFQPVLILGSHHSVIRQVADMLDEPVVVYNSSHLIRGVGLHIAKDLLFVSDGAGIVWCMPLGGSLPGSGSPMILANGNNRRGTNGAFGVSPVPSSVITSNQLGCNPLDLSIDWLNDHLYILGEVVNTEEETIQGDESWSAVDRDRPPHSWQVARCRLDGSGLTVAIAGFHAKPRHFEVDPYNGYLFWVVPGGWAPPWGGGLYRIDLADISNGVRHEVNPMLLMAASDLGAFAVDHSGFRILVPDHIHNTVFSVSLDGKEKNDLRGNTQQPMFRHVVSLSWAAGLFYWTDGQEVLTEEFHPVQRAYFHNTFPALSGDQPFSSVALAFPSAQPLPVPVNPPTQLQAVMGATLAKVSWQVPHLIGVQGKGAWQNWSYELQVQEEINGTIALHKDIITPVLGSASSLSMMSITNSMPTTTVTVHDLKPDTLYILKARAYTARGRGPWSAEFRGRTLRSSSWRGSDFPIETEEEEEKVLSNGKKEVGMSVSADGGAPLVLWSADAGLMASDITGDTVSTLIHKDNLKDPSPNGGTFHVQDVAWLGSDLLFLVANSTRLYWLNTTSHAWGAVGDIQYAGSVAIDWIGQRLYWSNPKQQLINRGNLNGTQQESLPILTVAKELNIDAIHAFIYWSTGHAVECSRLNGEDRRTYYPAELFSGKQVMGLTLDVDRRDAYWIVRSYEGSVLFKAPMANDGHWPPQGVDIPFQRVSNLQQSKVQGPLVYFSNHLLWLQGDIAVIGDMTGQNAALVSGESLTGLHTAAVIDPALHIYPDMSERVKVNVIPNPVPLDSIRVSGTWDLFRIGWSPVDNVNHGKVFYEVKMDDFTGKEIVVVVEQTWVEWPYQAKLRPYSRLAVSVRPFTYWGGSSGVGSGGRTRRAVLRTPQHLPSTPMSPRAFISFSRDPLKGVSQQETIATFRWDPPASTNGVILSYGVDCWLENISLEDSEKQGSFLYDDTKELLRDCDANATEPDHHRMDPQQLEFIAFNLSRNATYYFSVRAYTIVGGGPRTVPIPADTGEECPVPKLLLSTVNNAVQVADFDRHKGLPRQTEDDVYGNKGKGGLNGPSVDVAFISHEDRIFWLSETQAIMTSRLDGSNRTKIIALNNTGLSLAVDWVGRNLYWSEIDEGYEDDIGKDNSMHENWDWIGGNRRNNKGSSIHCIDLNEADNGSARPFLILQRSKIIHKIDVSPLTSELIWVEVNKKTIGTLMKSSMNGTNIQPFFMTNRVHTRRQNRDVLQKMDLCTCPSDPSVGLAMTVDQCKDQVNNVGSEMGDRSDETKIIGPDVLWVDAGMGHVYLADAEGCQCHLIVNASSNKGLPPTSVTSDGRNVYWSNSTEGKVYSAPKIADSYGRLKEDGQSKQKMIDAVSFRAAAMDVSGVRRIIALGPHLQPYPAPHCLSPWRKREYEGKKATMILLERTSHSISLQLPSPEKAPGCGSVSLASVQYTIHYGKIDIDSISLNGREPEIESKHNSSLQNHECGPSLIGCNTMVTYSKKIEISGLEPFSSYAFFVSMSNYYEQLEGTLPEVSSPEYFETSPGAPSPPREVSVAVNGPATAEVRWMAPAKPNGRHLEYEIHWSAKSPSGGVRHKGELIMQPTIYSGRSSNGSENSFLSTIIQNLLPDQNYLIWVRAYSEDHQEHSESESVSAATFPEPGNLVLLSATSDTLMVSWKPIQPTADPNAHIPTHTIQYMCMGMDDWVNLQPPTKMKGEDHLRGNLSYSVSGLQPKTRYTFRLSLKYPLSKEPYIWPPDGRFTFETLGDRPGMPGKPTVVQVPRGLFQVLWEVAPNNGAPILYYILEGRQRRPKDNANPKYANLSSSASTAEDEQGERKAVRAVIQPEWITLYNGSDNYWIIKGLGSGSMFEFRSRASNLYGLGEPSPLSAEFVVPPEGSWGPLASGIGNSGSMGASAIPAIDSGNHKRGLFLVLWSALPAILILLAVTIFIFIYVSRRRDKEQKALHGNGILSHSGLLPNHIHSHPHNPLHAHSHLHPHTHSTHPQNQGIIGTVPPMPTDVELATLRELPRHGNFVHARNALYSPSQLPDIPTILALQDQVPIMPEGAVDILADGEIDSLPHIRRDQITLTKFLGSGAFGEVFEGVARGLVPANGDVQGETRVAVKTLRKGATTMEKGEFLKEAQLMSNFRHEHILQLLGVCLDNDPNFIIMELMESGDLLSYLRSSRPLIYTPNALTLLDLVAMCVDVARGCRYLEEMHFVHRDLAARNCLVSTLTPNQPSVNSSFRPRLLVKIGDFGLARDIYKSDYYRKEGEGLLPVRWMAPESLVDGVFTCQSDVWSFGVLAWEILTLGQQPYPARNNLEVLHFVRNGGRLSRPANCPDALHSLMNQCWSYAPESRPTFKHCLQALEELQESNVLIGSIGAVQNGHYMRQMTHNAAESPTTHRFKEDEIQSQTHGIPKYLELLHEGEEPSRDGRVNEIADSISTCGYEVPRAPATVIEENDRLSSNKPQEEKQSATRVSRTFSTASTVSEEGIGMSRDGEVTDVQYQNMKGGENRGKEEEDGLGENVKRASWSDRETPVSCTDELLPQKRTAVEEGDSMTGERFGRSYCNIANQRPLLHSPKSLQDVTL